MTSSAGARILPALAYVTLVLAPGLPATAVELLQGRVGAITAEDWRISGLSFSIDTGAAVLNGDLRIESLELPSMDLALSDVLVQCRRIELSATEFSCLDARYRLNLPDSGSLEFPGEAVYERQSGATRFVLREVPLAQGKLTLRGTATDGALDIEYSGQMLQLEGLATIANQFAPGSIELAASGTGNLSGAAHLRDGTVTNASMTAELFGASASNEAGTMVSEGLHALLYIALLAGDERWHFELDISSAAGEAYVEPVYVNLGDSHIAFTAEGSVDAGLSELELTTFKMTQGSAMDLRGNLHARIGSDDGGPSLSGAFELRESSVSAIYTGLLQVFLAGTAAGDLVTDGTIAGVLIMDNNELSGLDLSLDQVSIDDEQGRFAVYGLNGELHWPGPGRDANDAETSRLKWDSASAWNIPFEAASIEANLGGDDFHLSMPLRVPTMGGALLINHLVLNDFGTEGASGLLDAELEQIELGQLTGAFGWPAFSGSLAGELPFLQYESGIVTLGGTLTAQAFGGDIEFANLRLEEPLGLVPRLYGDLRLRQLDLERLTDTFSFGLIQGRLSGEVAGLEMIAWEPVAMDLHLYTPPNDKSRRRISQRAVENLASVGGGGAAAALSSGFMKFFEEFSYDRIGIRCVLVNGICRMSGAGPAGESELGHGYYIVKGSGLPRIDVVGYRHQVSFSALVRQLEAITASGAPVVQ
ncbi:MAG TPA: hypothetical protein VKZ91_02970 [Woeseiaceae bacterium]|nr:hypothetical protein [Woeseiaceae bacterium]